MSTWTHRTMVVPATHVAMARTICETLAPGGSGGGMFTTPCSALGILPATHYVSAGLIWQQFADLLENPAALHAACQQAGLPYTLLQLQTLLSMSIVKKPADKPDPLADLVVAGLKIISEAL